MNKRLQEIELRLAAIRQELESDGADIDALTTETNNLLQERTTLMSQIETRTATLSMIANGLGGAATPAVPVVVPQERTFAVDSAEYRDAYFKSLMGKELDAQERAAVAATKAIPTQTMNKIIAKLEEYPLLNRATILNIAGNVSIPYEKTTTDANWVEMSASATDGEDELDSLTFLAHKLIKTVKIDADVENMAIDAFETFIVNKLVIKMQKALQTAMVAGTGSGQPTGIAKTAANKTTYTKAGLTYKDILKIMADLPSGYQASATWSMTSSVFFNEVLGLVDANGRPIVVQDASVGSGYRLMGHPVDFIEKDGVITYGDHSKYYFNFSKAMEVKADSSVEFRAGAVVYRGMALVDGGLVDKDAVVYATKATA